MALPASSYLGLFTLVIGYIIYSICRPVFAAYIFYNQAKNIGLPVKVLPFPPGTFSFIAHVVLKRLGLMHPGSKLHTLLNTGRPDGRGMHDELGDLYVTVNPLGLTLVVADPKVAAHVNTKRAEFPKPPNTGALINIYGKNVINADGDIWRFHRRVTGPVFSERIHADVWRQSVIQATNMAKYWIGNSTADSVLVPTPQVDALRLGFNVITSAAYGCPIGWDESPPYLDLFNPSKSVSPPPFSYRESLEQVNSYLLQLFLTPKSLLRLAPRNTTWGKAWEAYTTFGGYMRGMIEREREIQVSGGGVDVPENLLSVLLGAENGSGLSEKEERQMTPEEVMGNAFIFIFAGHETTANTTHYALVRLALHSQFQDTLLSEVDAAYQRASDEGRSTLEYESDFGSAQYAMALMSETLRIHTPTGMTNKYAAVAQPIVFNGQTYVIPAETRISVNGLAIHNSREVWGDDVTEFNPGRWIVPSEGPATPGFGSARNSWIKSNSSIRDWRSMMQIPSPLQQSASLPATTLPSPTSSPEHSPLSSPPASPSRSTPPSSPEITPVVKVHVIPPPLNLENAKTFNETTRLPSSPTPSTNSSIFPATTLGPGSALFKPPKGTFLPFSEGSRACSGKKFASVEFVAVLYTLLKEHRVELALDQPGWSRERVMKVLAGRKAGALTLAVPEHIPLRFVKR
ncbi:cytochrome P450 [Mycena floridula]|nr:cytochrome P450 [Mycena floridula]